MGIIARLDLQHYIGINYLVLPEEILENGKNGFLFENNSSESFIEKFEGAGGYGLSEEEVTDVLSSKGFENFNLVKGNVFDTLPKYLSDNPETRIALLHLDMDVKEPTDFALELLYDRVVPGGIIVFDDYNAVVGETISVDEFVAKHKLKLEKLPFYNVPAYVRKPI